MQQIKSNNLYCDVPFAVNGTDSEAFKTVAERLPNSELLLFDPQTGKEFNWDEKAKRIDIAQGLFVLKVDGLMLNASVVKTVVKAKG